MFSVKHNSGFTLIELLIASVILISAISLSQIAYSQYVKLVVKQKGAADKYLVIMQAKNLIDLNSDIKSLSGNYSFNAHTINWEGTVKDSFREQAFESDVNSFTKKPNTYYLIDYKLELTIAGGTSQLTNIYSRFMVDKDAAVSYEER